jgi:aspartyl-tRNA(Asn)/glutamyl-tRNA(Gln) amidotransferase subunit C
MTKLDKSAIQDLKRLARIALSESEEERLLETLSQVLTYVEQLQEVDTENVACCNSVLPSMVNVTRADEVGETLDRDTFLKNSPDHVGGMIRVPPVINK